MATESNHIVAAEHHFKLYKGDTWQSDFTFVDEDDTPINLSTATLLMQIKRRITDSLPLKTFTELDGLVVSGADSNVVTITWTPDLNSGDYVYDFQTTWPGGIVTTYMRGRIIITEDV